VKRLLLNGSPRGKDANSRRILAWIAEGLEQAGIARPALVDLAPDPTRAAHLQAFLEADEIVFACPLYTDSMPGLVKAFLEAMAQADSTRLRGKRVAFVIQSGFPEGIHTEALGAYLARLCERLGFVHLGTLRKGNVEGIRMMPPKQVAKIQARFVEAGRELGTEGRFSPERIRAMAEPRTFGWKSLGLARLIGAIVLINYYWNQMLKQHGAYERRFDRPYLALGDADGWGTGTAEQYLDGHAPSGHQVVAIGSVQHDA
jgi:NAD(P)H-dependent FMN reductase